jgi:polar amino acid transport system ATP-binding protein
MPILEVKNLKKKFDNTQILKGISFDLEEGQSLSIIGSSGSGKTTLLRCLNFLETPDEGEILVKGETLFDGKGKADDAKQLRNKRLHFGLVFQQFNLFPQYTALENVTLAPLLAASGNEKNAIIENGKQLLDQMGLSDRMDNYPHQLSGGQQQRVALARTLAQNPQIILADEPVAALDPVTANQVMGDFKRINEEMNISILINIHHIDLALKYATRVIGIRAGEIVFDGPASEATQEVLDKIYNGKVDRDGNIQEEG